MAHEDSETFQNPMSRWFNAYGSKTPNAGKQLPATYPWEIEGQTWPNPEQAVNAAKQRSGNNEVPGLRQWDPKTGMPVHMQPNPMDAVIRFIMQNLMRGQQPNLP